MARLPMPGGDQGQWGDILNDFLRVDHNADGTLKSASVSAALSDGSITKAKLATSVQSSLDNADAAASGTVADGSITSAKIADDTITNAEISTSAAIATSKIAGLDAALTGKAATVHVHAATDLTSGTVAPARLGGGTASSTTFLRGDNTWVAPPTASNATNATLGLIQLSGDLTGSAASPVIASGVISDASIAAGAAIAQSKIAGLSASLAAKYTTPSGGIPESDLDSAVQTKLNTAAVIADGSVTNAKLDAPTQAALASITAKADDNLVIKLAGTQTVTGDKTFTGVTVVPTPTDGTHAATKAYVDGVASSGGIPDADGTTKGAIRLAGDLAGTADTPVVAAGSITSAKIADDTIVDADISASAAIAQSKVSGLVASLSSKVATTGDETVAGIKTFSSSPVVPTPTDGTHAATKAYVDGVASSGGIPDADGTTKGAIRLAGDLAGTADTPVVANDAITNVKISASAAIATSKIAGLDAALTSKAADSSVVHLAGIETISGVKTFSASPIVPTPTTATQAATKGYVDTAVVTGNTPDATTSVKGKIQLAGDLTGTASSPAIAAGAVTTTHIVNAAVTSAKLADNSITTSKIDAAGLAPTVITGTAVVTADTRLTNARTPTAHKASHAIGGNDLLTPSDIGAATAVVAPNIQGADYTIVLSDAGKMIEFTGVSLQTLTVPEDDITAFSIGTVIDLSQVGEGAVMVTAADGVTIQSEGSKRMLGGQFTEGRLYKRGINQWRLSGVLADAPPRSYELLMEDSFTQGATAVSLESHTPDYIDPSVVGAAWVLHPASTSIGAFLGGADVNQQQNQAYNAQGGSTRALYRAALDLGSADYSVTGNFKLITATTGGHLLSLVARLDATADTGYHARIGATETGGPGGVPAMEIVIAKRVAGVNTDLTTIYVPDATAAAPGGQVWRLRFDCFDDEKAVWIQGPSDLELYKVATTLDNSITAKGYAGAYWIRCPATLGAHLDHFQVEGIASSVVAEPPFWQTNYAITTSPYSWDAWQGVAGRLSVVPAPGSGSDPFKPSGNVLRAQLDNGDTSANGHRAEVYGRRPSPWSTPYQDWPDPAGSTRWYSFYYYCDVFLNSASWCTITQLKGFNGGQPPVAIGVENGNLLLDGNTRFVMAPFLAGQWTKLEMCVKHAASADASPANGSVQIFRDNVEVFPTTAVQTMDLINGAVDPTYLKQGLYASTGLPSWVVYHGPTKVGPTRASVQ